MTWRRWREATTDALYGPSGFYHRPEGGPGAHFRTSSTATPLFARALARLAIGVDEALGRPDPFLLVEVAAARGALLTALAAALAEESPGLAARARLVGVELAGRPDHLPAAIGWTAEVPAGAVGLVVANEWLDNVPCEVVELGADGVRYVEVDESGSERLGDRLEPPDQAWLDTWWPLEEEGDRAEIGRPRDEAWADVVRRVRRGVALAIDYSHVREERVAGAYPGGTLAGYREGRAVAPVPDGGCDITAHVALDSVAAAAAGDETVTVLTDQRAALRALGVSGALPPVELASRDPRRYIAELNAASAAAELLARGGLGDFGWLAHGIGVTPPIPGGEATR